MRRRNARCRSIRTRERDAGTSAPFAEGDKELSRRGVTWFRSRRGDAALRKSIVRRVTFCQVQFFSALSTFAG